MSAQPIPARHQPLGSRMRDEIAAGPEFYDFFITMRTLEARNLGAPRIGRSETLRDEYVTLGQDPFVIFPDSNLSKAELDRIGRLRVLVRFLGMLGPQGALPMPTTEEALNYVSRGDTAFARFLDLFNNRFLQLFFRAWADARPITQADRADDDRFRIYFGAPIGIGSPLATNLDSIPDTIKLAFAGLMGANAKSATRLAALVTGVFGIRSEVEEFVGSWLTLARSDRSRLGGTHAALGGTLMLGERTFSVSDKFRLRLIAGTLEEYEKYLPVGVHAEQISDLVTFYLGEEMEWDVELALPACEAKPMKLGTFGRLGWTSWLAPDWSVAGDSLRADARSNLHRRIKHARARARAGTIDN